MDIACECKKKESCEKSAGSSELPEAGTAAQGLA